MFAHSANSSGRWQPLREHLENVARLAGEFAAPFGGGEVAYHAGLWHDVGKADPAWQEYLRESAAGRRARGTGPDHKAAGASIAMEAGQQAIALLIQAHHGGLQEGRTGFVPWFQQAGCLPGPRAARASITALVDVQPASAISLPPSIESDPLASELFLRLVYSALVDADSLDTEQHYLAPGTATAPRGSDISMNALWRSFQQDQRVIRSSSSATVDRVRTEVYEACIAAAELPPGLFRLTVPTGGGKTRSAMAFALCHALKHGMTRVIVAVPFTTITEQTAQVYREIFEGAQAEPVVLEHHSRALDSAISDESFDGRSVWDRLAAENWEAPVVVTTTVQLFESLLSNLRSKTRKLHNIANSVVVLDEAQALPASLLDPILSVLGHLASNFGTTVVFSTATQPAFDIIPSFSGSSAREIVPGNVEHFAAMRRVEYEWRLSEPHAWDEVASWIGEEAQTLCIVNVKRHATALLDALTETDGVLHISTLLCGAHRRDVLVEIKRRLALGLTCRVVSTQVVEAGVDLDFPIVFRSLGPLDSVIQAAGRCNREGLLAGLGRVIVFQPADNGSPPGVYRTGTDVGRVLAANPTFDPNDPASVRRYSELLLPLADTDAKQVQEVRRMLDFPETAKRFRMIDDDTEDVLVLYGNESERAEVERVASRLESGDPNVRLLLRRLQPYVVSVRRQAADGLRRDGLISSTQLAPGLSRWLGRYDTSLRGLVEEDADYVV